MLVLAEGKHHVIILIMRSSTKQLTKYVYFSFLWFGKSGSIVADWVKMVEKKLSPPRDK